jgi:perosamine synthetase
MKKIYLSEPDLSKTTKKHIINTIESNFVSSVGPNVGSFENTIKKIYKYKYVLAVNSGTSALHIALLAHSVKKNDLVIIPSYTFAATANSILYCGAEPWFFDICPDNMMIDVDKIEKILSKKTILINNITYHKKTKKRVAAIIPVFSFGQAPDISILKKIKKKYNIDIILDSAAGHFADFKQEVISKFNFASIISFNGNKSITTGSGGVFMTNNKLIFNKAKLLINIGRYAKYKYQLIGYNYKMNNLQASLGISQYKNFEYFKKKKKEIFYLYSLFLKKNIVFELPHLKKYQNSALWLFYLKFNNVPMLEKIKNYLRKKKIFVDKFWVPLTLQPIYKKYIKENLKNTINEYSKILILPSSTFLKKKQIMQISKEINKLI